MQKRNIIVIGASAGGFEALKKLVRNLPKDLEASIFVVWHMSADIRGVLPQVLNREGTVPASQAVDGEPIEPNRIYVAAPDHHLLIEDGRVRVTRGPKENRFRPAVDPLFRSAAYSYGERAVGVILSGALDDGTSGLWTIKHHGGTTVVQDPNDAEVPSMPENALLEVDVDYSVPVAEMADLLVRLTREEKEVSEAFMEENDNELTKTEISIAAQDNAFERGFMRFGELTPFTCPDCHGVLFKLKDGTRPRFRCHTGHAFSSDALLTTVTESIEDSLWNAVRGIEESIMLLNHMGEHFSESKQTRLAVLYFQKAREAQQRAQVVRKAIFDHERLSEDKLRDIALQSNGGSRTGDE